MVSYKTMLYKGIEMDILITRIEGYLKEALGIECSIASDGEELRFPHYIKSVYKICSGKLLNQTCHFVIDTRDNEETPGRISKNMQVIQKKFDADVIYVRTSMTAINRTRLIGHKVSFIVPENQMYLPLVGIDLREHYKTQKNRDIQTLSPSAQAIFLYCLLQRMEMGKSELFYSTKELEALLNYSKMTVTRACKELLQLNLFKYEGSPKRGKYHLSQNNSHQCWERALPYLQSPVKSKRFMLAGLQKGCIAGENALSMFSMLGAPRSPQFALTSKQFKQIEDNGTIISNSDPEAIEYEIWSYDPAQLTTNNTVDKLSLYLSLKSENDERVQMSLEEMIEEIKW